MSRPRILIDASSVTATPDGLSTYIVQMIRHLPEAAPDLDFTVLLTPGVSRPDLDAALRQSGAKVWHERLAPIGPRRDWRFLRLLPRIRADFDLCHITAMTYPFALKGGVCTVHDLTYRIWFHGNWLYRAASRVYLDAVLRNCMKRAGAIVAVSDQTRLDLADLVGRDLAAVPQVRVVHEGWEHMAERPEGDPVPANVPQSNYLFYLGTNRAHKNLTNLLLAFELALAQLPPKKCLVITGSSARLNQEQAVIVTRINRDAERIVFTGFVSDRAVAELFERADAFVFPSFKEGFGLPILEAFHHGTPLLASTAPAIPEVAGDAALFFDPHSAASIAETITKFYAEPELSEQLIARGKARLLEFSWAKAAAQTAEIYREVLANQA